jgi:cytochrome c-type biogenesis protein CcmF
VFPLIAEAVNDRPVTVGPPYFNRMTVPIGLALLFLMAVAPVLPWRKASGEVLAKRLFWPAWAAVITMVVTVALGARGLGTVLTFGLGAFAGGAAVRQIALATRRQGWRGFVGRANGGMVVHLGVVIIAVAIAANGHYLQEVEARFEPGETRTIGGHEITYLRTDVVEERNRTATKVSVQIDGGQVYRPALSQYAGFGSLIGTPSVRTGLREDVYLTVVRLPEEGATAVTLRVIIQPMALWLWIGGGVMAFGTILAAWPGRRRRVPTDPTSAPIPLDDVPDPTPTPDAVPEPVGSA